MYCGAKRSSAALIVMRLSATGRNMTGLSTRRHCAAMCTTASHMISHTAIWALATSSPPVALQHPSIWKYDLCLTQLCGTQGHRLQDEYKHTLCRPCRCCCHLLASCLPLQVSDDTRISAIHIFYCRSQYSRQQLMITCDTLLRSRAVQHHHPRSQSHAISI